MTAGDPVNRTLDGTIAPEDPCAAAAKAQAEVQAETGGRRSVWWGPENGRVMAAECRPGGGFVEAATTEKLIDAMEREPERGPDR
jgi:hypothetical protein